MTSVAASVAFVFGFVNLNQSGGSNYKVAPSSGESSSTSIDSVTSSTQANSTNTEEVKLRETSACWRFYPIDLDDALLFPLVCSPMTVSEPSAEELSNSVAVLLDQQTIDLTELYKFDWVRGCKVTSETTKPSETRTGESTSDEALTREEQHFVDCIVSHLDSSTDQVSLKAVGDEIHIFSKEQLIGKMSKL